MEYIARYLILGYAWKDCRCTFRNPKFSTLEYHFHSNNDDEAIKIAEKYQRDFCPSSKLSNLLRIEEVVL